MQKKKNLPAMQENLGSISGLGRSPREGPGNPLQYACLENSRDRGARQAAVPGVTKAWTQLVTNTFTSFFSWHQGNQSWSCLHVSRKLCLISLIPTDRASFPLAHALILPVTPSTSTIACLPSVSQEKKNRASEFHEQFHITSNELVKYKEQV